MIKYKIKGIWGSDGGMTQFVNAEALSKWYQSVSKSEWDERQVLDEVFRQFLETRREVFVLPADRTKTGREECYSFRMEHLNCCGADRVIISF